MARRKSEVPSPCIDVCKLNETGELCIGCYRTIDEIGRWKDAGDDERRAIREAAAVRAREASAHGR